MSDYFKLFFSLRNQKKRLLTVMFIAFLAALTLARSYAVFVGNSIFLRGYQIHHFYFGMFCLSVGGFVALLVKDTKGQYFASAIMGIGFGLFVDEIGLLLNCTTINHACSYAFPDTFDIFGTAIVTLLLIMFITDLAERRNNSLSTLQPGTTVLTNLPNKKNQKN